MNEVKERWYAGPYEESCIPMKWYVQSPIGLVPKAENKKRLIFHLSYDFNKEDRSVNACTPEHLWHEPTNLFFQE